MHIHVYHLDTHTYRSLRYICIQIYQGNTSYAFYIHTTHMHGKFSQNVVVFCIIFVCHNCVCPIVLEIVTQTPSKKKFNKTRYNHTCNVFWIFIFCFSFQVLNCIRVFENTKKSVLTTRFFRFCLNVLSCVRILLLRCFKCL